MLFFCLAQPELVHRLRAEAARAFASQTDAGCAVPDILVLLNDCPLLNACFDETLRLVGVGTSVRAAEKDVLVGGYRIPAGSTVLLPSAHLHKSKSAWGNDVREFRPERILEVGSSSKSLRPFGGGETLCPGRFFARRAVIAFVASMLQYFDLRMSGADGFYERAANPKMKSSLVVDASGERDGLRLHVAARSL